MYKMESKIINDFNPVYISKIKKGWRWLLAMGISFIIIGGISIFKFLTTTIVSLYILGFVIMFSGIGYAIYSFKFWKYNWAKFSQYLILGIIYIVASFVIIQDPLRSAFPITIFIAVFYMVVGVWRTISSFRFRLPRAFLEFLGGIIALIFGILIWLEWPSSSLWVIGLFVGIDIILTGIYFTALSLFAKKLITSGL